MKLLFNGCSFTAGDLITWHQHYPDITSDQLYARVSHPRYTREEITEFAQHYQQVLRPRDNLAATTAGLLNLDSVDLSQDGASNQSIAHTTISWVDQNPGDYCLCIGWTEPARRLIWDGAAWVTLSAQRLRDRQLPPHIARWIEAAIVNSHDSTHHLDYYSSVLLLYNWARARGLPLIFWRSMGEPFTLPTGCGWSSSISSPSAQLSTDIWLDGFNGDSWLSRMHSDDWIAEHNSHPNSTAMLAQAQRIKRHFLDRSLNS
jgi:hypothetical protein